MGAIQYKSDQQVYIGRGPLDAKSVRKTFSQLLDADKWTTSGTFTAYNGMIVAVWLDTEENNGIYYLHDPNITKATERPDVTDPNNWHKISSTVDLSSMEERLDELETDTKLHTYGYRVGFPEVGQDGHMYIAVDEQTTYVWFNSQYIELNDSNNDFEVVYGGSAN